MARVTQFVIRGENKPGTLAQISSELAKVAVNITGIMASPESGEGIRMVAEPHAAAKKVLDSLQVPYSEEHGLAVRLTDRPGALGRLTRKLAEAGINITYIYATIVKGQEKGTVVLGVADQDLEKAAALV
jgi:hypothetical protein